MTATAKLWMVVEKSSEVLAVNQEELLTSDRLLHR